MGVRLLVGCLALLPLSCGSSKFATVSGRVTMNGKPLVGATVSFTPLGDDKSIEAPPGSVGKTNANGEYTLKAVNGKDGALVGKHKVAISLLSEQIKEGDARPRGGWPITDLIPDRYNENTELTCDVPPGGKTDANFDLTSP